MRLDRYISENTQLSRKEAKQALHRGEVAVDGHIIKKGDTKILHQSVTLAGVVITPIGPVYLMLHKPDGYVCSTVDDDGPSVLNLVEPVLRQQLHIAGRLDKDTTGLVLLTNDGQWSHRIASPRHECSKVYLVDVEQPLEGSLVEKFSKGIALNNESSLTKPATLEILSQMRARLTITQGKYHQVKRMFAAVGNHVVKLHRESIGTVQLPDTLSEGEVAPLTEQQVVSFLP